MNNIYIGQQLTYVNWDIDKIFEDFDEEEFNLPDEFIGHEQFYDFLNSEGIYDSFVRLYKPVIAHNNTLKEYLDKELPTGYISGAFCWDDHCWENYHDKWVSICHSNANLRGKDYYMDWDDLE